jgi:hypothetical protein
VAQTPERASREYPAGKALSHTDDKAESTIAAIVNDIQASA